MIGFGSLHARDASSLFDIVTLILFLVFRIIFENSENFFDLQIHILDFFRFVYQ